MIKRIYVFGVYDFQNIAGFAIDKIVTNSDGTERMNCLAKYESSDEIWCKHDMGITSNRKHDIYKERYPDGYELEFLGVFHDLMEPMKIIRKVD